MTTLAEFRNRHRGAGILVCGCGESLNLLERPEGLITIGVNDVGRRFDPTYLVVVNPREQFAAGRFQYVARSAASCLFTPFDLGAVRPPVARFKLGRYGGADCDDPETLPYTQNSPYVALCLAVHLGATRIGLIGVDFTDHHFFGATGAHPLSHQLATIDGQYRALYQALQARGVDVYNLSPSSRLSAIPKLPLSEFMSRAADGAPTPQSAGAALNIVSYATTPVAGVPAILARCIAARTPHTARCVWSTAGYANGVDFQGDIQWREAPRLALETLETADLIIVHNGKVDPAHRTLIERRPAIVLAHNYGWNVDMSLVRQGRPGAVVGQYQALLPEFQDWTPVPNPLPLWEADYLPGEKDDRITIAYTPSGKHERYPVGHSLYWHGKGYQTTLRILERLAGRYPLRLNVIRDRQVDHAEALALKRSAHIVIDECVTGGYHRNSLEGLAGGCVVVNGFGLLPGLPELTRRLAGEDPPFVPAGLDTLEATLESLIAQDRERLLEQGRLNRAWLERCWDFDRQWRRFWCPLIERALQHRALPTPCLKQGGVLPAPAPAGVSVVIPHGGLQRLPHLTASLENLARCRGVNEIIVAELGQAPVACELARRHGAKYVFIHSEGPFERARGLNAGSSLAESDLILWKDNDLLLDSEFVGRAATELLERKLDFLIPYTCVRYLTEVDSGAIIDRHSEPAAVRPDRILYGGRDSSGGAGLVRREFLTRYGGMDEAFRGWGGEDNAWMRKAYLLGKAAATERPDQILYHLYHPDSGAHAGRPLDHPHYQANLARLREYAAAADGAQLLRRFPPAGHWNCPWDPHYKIVFIAEEGESRAATTARGLRELYGITVTIFRPGEAPVEETDVAVLFGDKPALGILNDSRWAARWSRTLAVLPAPSAAPALHRAAGVLAPGAKPPLWPWRDGSAQAMAAALAQPLSLIQNDKPFVWLYWEGECPDWIQSCRQTILAHAPRVRLLGPRDFDRLWDRDRDIDLRRLHVAHRADFIRAFLLARYGGLWIDSDCIVMRSLAEVLDALEQYDFVAHRDRQGYYPNGFIGARPGSRIAAELYRRICERLRSDQSLGWIALGGEPLTAILRRTQARWLELPCDYIQPICWSRPEVFFARGDTDRHARQFDGRALCYMLSNTEIQRYRTAHPGTELLAQDTFFRYLLTQAMNERPAGRTAEVFTAIYRERLQVHDESVSGPGSSLAQTARLRQLLPGLLRRIQVRSLLDAGCGDCHWLARVDLGGIDYIGVDVVAELIAHNQERARNSRRRFLKLDFVVEPLPRADLILCRDALVLLPYAEALAALRNFRASGSIWLLATTFPGRVNTDTATGCWRPLDLQAVPFSLPPPLQLLKEGCSEAGGRYADKSLGLWRLANLSL